MRVSDLLDKNRLRKEVRDRVEIIRRQAVDKMEEWVHLRDRILDHSTYQVRPSDEGWAILQKDAKAPFRVFPRKSDAVREARKIAKEKRAYLDVFSKKGSLESHKSYWVPS